MIAKQPDIDTPTFLADATTRIDQSLHQVTPWFCKVKWIGPLWWRHSDPGIYGLWPQGNALEAWGHWKLPTIKKGRATIWLHDPQS